MAEGFERNDSFLPTLARFLIGAVFIFSAIYKLFKPDLFVIALRDVSFLSNFGDPYIKVLFPFVELVSAAVVMFFKKAQKYGAIGLVAVLTFYLVTNTVNIINEEYKTCNCIADYLFLSKGIIHIVIIRDSLLLILLLGIIKSSAEQVKHRRPIKRLLYQILLVCSLLFLFGTPFVQKIEENKSMSEINYYLNRISEDIYSKYGNLIGINVKEKCDMASEQYLGYKPKLIIMYIINDIDCSDCIEEAIYLQQLAFKMKQRIFILGIVPRIGSTAIKSFCQRFNIEYPVIQTYCPFLEIFNVFNSIKLTLNSDWEILRIDPPTLSIKKARNNYERLIMNLLEN